MNYRISIVSGAFRTPDSRVFTDLVNQFWWFWPRFCCCSSHCPVETQKKRKMRITPRPPQINRVSEGHQSGFKHKIEPVSHSQRVSDNGRKQTEQKQKPSTMLKTNSKVLRKPGLARWRHSVPFISQFIAQMRTGRRLASERPEPGQVNRRYQTTSRLKQQSEQDSSTVERSRIIWPDSN